ASKIPLLFQQRWAQDFLSRRAAAQAPDPRQLAAPYFREVLSSPYAGKAAADHLAAHARAVYGKDVADLIAKDVEEGAASEKTIGWIAKYLLDQRQLWRAHATAERLASLDRVRGMKPALADLRLVAPALAKSRSALDGARAALAAAPSEPRLRLSAEKIHVLAKDDAPGFDVGDEAEVTLAYWVEGLAKGESAYLTEAGFLESPSGKPVSSRVSRARRKAGGPYLFSAKVVLGAPGKHRYRFVLAGPGAIAVNRDVEIAVSPAFTEAILSAARAEEAAGACHPSEAFAAYGRLADSLTGSARKPQFRRLQSVARERAAVLGRQAELIGQFAPLVEQARRAASKEACDYRDAAAVKALAALRAWPAGSDRLLLAGTPVAAEVWDLLRAAQRRRGLQDAFSAAAARASSLEDSCKAPEAAEAYASALALLDGEPEARCGPWAQEHEKIVSQALPRARSAAALSQSIVEDEAEALKRYGHGDFAGALSVLEPLLAKIDFLPERKCYKEPRRQAQELADASAASLGPDAAGRPALPEDDPAPQAQEVLQERRRLDVLEEARRRRETLREQPNSAAPVQGAAPSTGADAPEKAQ
ncbi:MAG TPA: hypothetical protein VNI01_14560, partial [Elusimicrobiota bacterium]|nr:hypothetical protein [Elusimicrobiota bacterium]